MDDLNFVKKVKCSNCYHEFNMTFIAKNGDVVNKIEPTNCPKCGYEKFVGRFEGIQNWIGSYGSNE